MNLRVSIVVIRQAKTVASLEFWVHEDREKYMDSRHMQQVELIGFVD